MKKALSIILTAVLLLSVFCVPVYAAENDKPEPTSGPWDGFFWMTGGPMISFVGGSVGNRVERLVYYRENMMMESSPIVTDNEAVPGATYDKPTNTLTLDNVKLTDNLGIYYMGDDFRLCVKGECELTKITVFNFSGKYSTSLNITGTGTLTLNKEKTYSEAIEFFSDGDSLMHFDIAPSVTVHLYASAYEDEEFPQNVVNINSTYADPAITVGGKAIPEAKSERRVEKISETVNALWLDNPDHVYQRGKRVISKTDPDGIYAVEEIEFNTGSGYEPRLCVTKYIQSPFDIDMPDPEFTKEYGDYIILTQEEFNAGYDYVIAPQPKKIRYTSDYRVANRGYRGVKFIKDGDPGTVYIGTPGWTIPYGNELDEEIESYNLYSASWNEDEQLYVAERTAVEKHKTAEELEAKGYTIVTDETSGQRVEVQYIDTNYKYENYSTEAILLIDKHGNEYSAEVLNWDTGNTQYFVQLLEWREDKGRYYSHYDVGQLYFGDPPYDSMEEIEAAGYTIVLEDQPVDYTITGQVTTASMALFKDSAGNSYYKGYDGTVYSISENDKFTYGDKEYYIGTAAEGVESADLQQISREETRDDQMWWIEGTEYHHKGEAVEPQVYELWVNNEQFADDHLVIQCGDGTATFDPATYTLTLDNAQITKGAEKDWLYTGILDFLDEELTIVVNGDCAITETGGDGIGSYQFDENWQMVPHDMTVKGDGKLTIKESTPMYGYGFYCTGALTLDGVDIAIESAATGVWAKELSIKNSSIDSDCSTGYSGIVVNNGEFRFENSTVNATSVQGAGLLLGNNVDPANLELVSGTLTLRGSVGIDCEENVNSTVTINGGKFDAAGTDTLFEYLPEDRFTLGENVAVTSGGFDQNNIVIEETVKPEIIIGDLNDDGIADVLDAVMIQKYAVDKIELTDEQKYVADVNGDGTVDILDAVMIQKYAVDKISGFTKES